MVITHKMNENEIGYRGSKSEYKLKANPKKIYNFVKEQRADGNYFINHKLMKLRCALMGFERNYLIRILAKQLLNSRAQPYRNFSNLSSPIFQSIINPWFITGFTDAEGSFMVIITKKGGKSSLKWRVVPSFAIHIHNKDIYLLNQIQKTLGVGKVRKNSNTTVLFRVDNLKELQIIIDHFDRYPLLSVKASDYILFKECYNLIIKKQHLTSKGFEKILSLKYNLNKGLPDRLKKSFPNIVPVNRPDYKFINIPNPYWISGFASGDSTFSVSIEKSNNKTGKRVRLIFGTCLHIKDKELLTGIANYFYNSFEFSNTAGSFLFLLL
jgi:LAGLIDADG endonuclease